MPTTDEADRTRLRTRLGWLVLIWACSVAALGLVAWVLRYWLR